MNRILMFGYDSVIVNTLIQEHYCVDLILDPWDLLDDIPDIESLNERRIFVNDSTNLENVIETIYRVYEAPMYDVIFSRYESTIVIAATLSEVISKTKFLSLETALKFRDKYLQKSLLKTEVTVTDFELVENSDFVNFDELKINYPLVAKPYNGAGTALTFLINSATELKEKFEVYNKNKSKTVLLEEFVQGEEYQIDGFVQHEELVFLISKYAKPILKIKEGYIVNSMGLNPLFYKDTYIELTKLVNKVISKLNLKNSVFHMEFFLDTSKKWIFSEAAARIGGGFSSELFESTYGLSLNLILQKLITNQKIALTHKIDENYYAYTFIQPLNQMLIKLPTENELKELFPFIKKVIYEWKPGDEIPDESINSVKRTGLVLLTDYDEAKINKDIELIFNYFENLKNKGY